jgi:hypothetical protein
MQLEPFIDGVVDDIISLSSLADDPNAAESGARVARAMGPHLRMRLLDLLTQAAVEVSAALPDGHVEVRLGGPDPTFVHVGGPAPLEPAPAAAEELSARLTLRLSDSLKEAIDRAAEREQVSVNSWVVRALKRALDTPPPGRAGRRLTGYAQS